MDKILVIVDNGHGAETPGKRSPDGRLREYDWCRKAARRLCGELGRRGVEAVLLVPEDADIALSERCRRARNLGPGRRAVLVSLHCNAAGNGKEWLGASGWSAFVAPEAGAESRHLAVLMTGVARRRGLLGNRCTPPCGYWTAPLAICRGVPFPAVLTENMFQDNRSDAAFLMSDRGLEEIVALHADAICEYYEGE